MSDKKLWLPIRNRRFGLIWLGQILSQVGTRMYQIAIAWWLVQYGGETQGFKLAMLFLIASLPALIFAKKIGQLVDRSSARTLILACEVAAALACFALASVSASGVAMLVGVYVVGFALALAQALVDPALLKATPEIVGKEDTEGAMGLVTTTTTVASLFGAFVGAFVIDRLGVSGAVVVNGLSYVLSALFIAQIRTSRGTVAASEEAGGELVSVPNYPVLRSILIAFAAVNFFSVPTLVVIPLYTKRILSGEASHLALLEGGLAVGMLLGSVVSSRIPTSLAPFRLVAICLLCLGLSLGLPTQVRSIVVYLLSLAMVGGAMGLLNVKIITFFQTIVPDALKGRFFAQLNALTSFTFPMSFFLFGLLTDHLPLETVIAIQAVGIAAVSLWFFRLIPEGKRLWA